MIYLITLEKKPIRAMPDFDKAIETHSNGWYRIMNNCWLSNVQFPAKQYAELLQKTMGPRDSILITKIADDFSGWLPQDAWTWINDVRNLGLK